MDPYPSTMRRYLASTRSLLVMEYRIPHGQHRLRVVSNGQLIGMDSNLKQYV